MENYGSTEHIAQRVEAAKTAEEWRGAGDEPGLQVWRIEQFNVKNTPRPEYGHFYNGDSYIVLHTYLTKEGGAKRYDVHFWIGSESTQDEYTVAAYKTVELDDLLGDVPVQHREVEGHESKLFLSYFDGSNKNNAAIGATRPFQVSHGGVESGFNRVKPDEFRARLYHVKGKRDIRIEEVPLEFSSLNFGDVFLVDTGNKLYIWEPSDASRVEKFGASRFSVALRNDRGGKCVEERVPEEGSDEFWALFAGDKSDIKSAAEGGDDNLQQPQQALCKLWRLSDCTGELKFDKIAEAPKLSRSQLDSSDAFVIDCNDVVFVWVGKGASTEERKNIMRQANAYLGMEKKPIWTPVTRLLEGQEDEDPVFAKLMS